MEKHGALFLSVGNVESFKSELLYKIYSRLHVDSDSGSCEKVEIIDDVGPNEDRERQFLGLDLG